MPEEVTQQQSAGNLDEVERQLATFVDTIPALAWMANGDGWIFWYNQRWYEYTGSTPEQMEGWGWQSVHHPATLPRVMSAWTESISTGRPFEMVFPLRGADGIFRSFITRIVPVKDADGNITRWFGTNAEIDELQRTRDALADTEAQFRQIAEGLPQLVWVTRPDGYHEWYNQRWYDYTGTVPEQCVGTAWNGFFHPDDQERARRRWQHSLETGEPYNIEYRCRRYDGEYRWFLGSALPLKNAEGEIVRWFGTCTDIHRQKVAEQERKQVEETLVQSEKLAIVGRLASSIAHEINNPLESVTNLLYLARGSNDPDVIQEYLEVAEREVRRVSAIANQTLRFHKQSTYATSVQAQALIEDALAIYLGRLANSSIRVEKRRRATVLVTCFEGEIRQVLANLIGNAMDATGVGGGRLILRTRDATNWSTGGKGIVITIADTGSGIDEAVRQKIFAAFFTTKGTSGTGLGLWVSSEIVTRHRGSLRFRSSQRPGRSGTVFSLFLPLQAAPR